MKLTQLAFGIQLMWHLETVHYEYTQGLVDQELWDATVQGIRGLPNSDWFNLAYPVWGANKGSAHRKSFVDLVLSQKE